MTAQRIRLTGHQPSPWRRRLRQWVPILDWGRTYDRDNLSRDLTAAVIVTIMLIPQSLAYAMLAGLPAHVGLYASVAPLVVYALFGSSRVLAVGPVAVVSLMTATTLGGLGLADPARYAAAALTLAFLSGLMLWAMAALRLGFLANFLSHPVISGFISASGLLIALTQLRTITGIRAPGNSLTDIVTGLVNHAQEFHGLTFAIGALSTGFLFWSRRSLKPLLRRLGLGPGAADMLGRLGPVAVIVVTTLMTWGFDWQSQGVKVVGHIPQGLPPLTLPLWQWDLWQTMLMPALLISIVGFVESVSVGQTLAARRRQRIEPDRELVALGASNISAAFSGGFPVTGGFARSVVNFDAGARTPAAGVFTAVGILGASLLLTPALFHLPQATLAATIIVAVLSLVDFSVLKRTWAFSRTDFLAVLVTLLVTLWQGVEPGLVAGVALSLLMYLYRTSRPHMAVVGLVPGTEHFRNIARHEVRTSEQVIGIRVDESLYFANARALEDFINDAVADRPNLRHVVLQCSAVNDIDASALESLEAIEHRLVDAGMQLHLSEVKGPVMDRLQRTHFLKHLSGQVYLTHYQAITVLAPWLASPGPGDPH